jgi:hypothetical protein
MPISPKTIINLEASFNEAMAQEKSPVSPSQRRAIAALIVQDFLQGEIVDTTATLKGGTKVPHFFNKIGGRYYDITRNELRAGAIIHVGAKPKDNEPVDVRTLMLAYEDNRRLYETVSKKVFN